AGRLADAPLRDAGDGAQHRSAHGTGTTSDCTQLCVDRAGQPCAGSGPEWAQAQFAAVAFAGRVCRAANCVMILYSALNRSIVADPLTTARIWQKISTPVRH